MSCGLLSDFLYLGLDLFLSKRYPVLRTLFFFFFKQKTAYEIGVRLVGSEMCIRDSLYSVEFTEIISRAPLKNSAK